MVRKIATNFNRLSRVH